MSVAPPDRAGRSFGDLTETTGTPVSREGADMIFSRYAYAAELAAGRRVLELGCGAGLGLGMVAGGADAAVGGDVDLDLLRAGRRHYGTRVPFVQLTAEALPFADASFDLVLFFEGSYYVPDVEAALDEMARVLAPGGRCVLVNANPERRDFIPSPRSHRYHTAGAMADALAARGLDVRVEGAFPVGEATLRDRVVVALRKGLQRLGLVPRTLKGRAALKRLVSGRLLTLPSEIGPGFGSVAGRSPIPPAAAPGFKVFYVTGERPSADQPLA